MLTSKEKQLEKITLYILNLFVRKEFEDTAKIGNKVISCFVENFTPTTKNQQIFADKCPAKLPNKNFISKNVSAKMRN